MSRFLVLLPLLACVDTPDEGMVQDAALERGDDWSSLDRIEPEGWGCFAWPTSGDAFDVDLEGRERVGWPLFNDGPCRMTVTLEDFAGLEVEHIADELHPAMDRVAQSLMETGRAEFWAYHQFTDDGLRVADVEMFSIRNRSASSSSKRAVGLTYSSDAPGSNFLPQVQRVRSGDLLVGSLELGERLRFAVMGPGRNGFELSPNDAGICTRFHKLVLEADDGDVYGSPVRPAFNRAFPVPFAREHGNVAAHAEPLADGEVLLVELVGCGGSSNAYEVRITGA